MLNRLIITLIILLTGFCMADARDNKGKEQREAWMKEMRQRHSEYLAKKLRLTDDQTVRFAAVLNRMDSELMELNDNARRVRDEVMKKGVDATDHEIERAAKTQFEVKEKEGKIEMKYYAEFKKILTPSQLLQFKSAEHSYMRYLIKHRNDRRAKAKGNQGPQKHRQREARGGNTPAVAK